MTSWGKKRTETLLMAVESQKVDSTRSSPTLAQTRGEKPQHFSQLLHPPSRRQACFHLPASGCSRPPPIAAQWKCTRRPREVSEAPQGGQRLDATTSGGGARGRCGRVGSVCGGGGGYRSTGRFRSPSSNPLCCTGVQIESDIVMSSA